MKLSSFITNLVCEGQVTVAASINPFSSDDLADTTNLLLEYYHNDLTDMPGTAPAFHSGTALWAARWIYRTAQLTLLRQPDANTVNELLPVHAPATAAEEVFSADLCLRFLPDLLSLAKGLSPDDPLVQHIFVTAAQWPFSSTGMNIAPSTALTVITTHPCLLQAYADRIIASKDAGRCNDPAVMTAVTASLGSYTDLLWPDFKLSFS